jgi:hypothetical protein
MQTAAQMIDALGGSASVARSTGWALTTIESWKGPNFIPAWRRDPLLKLAARLKVSLSAADFPKRVPRRPADNVQRVAA